jgi:hypothetical protein
MGDDNRPHPKNVPGPFYVLDGCCTACEVPVAEAPELFTFDESNHCYVKRQPRAKDEFDRALRAAWFAELECIRYRGNDAVILRRFELEPHNLPSPVHRLRLGIAPQQRRLRVRSQSTQPGCCRSRPAISIKSIEIVNFLLDRPGWAVYG